MDLTDAQWEILQRVFPEPRRADGKGRPPRDARAVLNAVLWILRTGAPWHDLPARYPPYQTCHRRFQKWQKDGRFEVILQVLAEDLVHRGKLDLSEGAIDATFAGAKKGGSAVGKTKRGKGTKIMAVTDGNGVPVGVHVVSASPHETQLVEATLDSSFAPKLPR